MAPNTSGQYKVSDQVRKLWLDPATKGKVFTMFQNCSYDPDRGWETLMYTGIFTYIYIYIYVVYLRSHLYICIHDPETYSGSTELQSIGCYIYICISRIFLNFKFTRIHIYMYIFLIYDKI